MENTIFNFKKITRTNVLHIFLFIISFLSFSLLVHATTSSGTDCHLLTETKASSQYGSPVNLFSATHEPLITVRCFEDDSSIVTVGNGEPIQYIYKQGFYMEGGEWVKTLFSGKSLVGDWIVGSATAELDGLENAEKGQVLAYICQKVGTSWKCGCGDEACTVPKWQRQEYSLPINSSSATKSSAQGDGELDIHYPSRYLGLPGEKVTLIGSGFELAPISKILWNGEVEESNVAAESSGRLEITIPNLPPGKYKIKVKEGKTISKYGVSVWIATGENLPAPVITSITPESGLQGGTFTIHGEGFTELNDVITTFGVLADLPSKDGKTIVIDEYDPFAEKLVSYTQDAKRFEYAMPVNVTIMNTSGNSNMKIFKLNI